MSDDRPQDVGRSHRRKGAPSPETAALLTEYQEAMRLELRTVLRELEGSPAPAGLLPDPEARPIRPPLGDRMRLWDLAIKLGRELGSAIDAEPTPAEAAPSRPRRRARVDYG